MEKLGLCRHFDIFYVLPGPDIHLTGPDCIEMQGLTLQSLHIRLMNGRS